MKYHAFVVTSNRQWRVYSVVDDLIRGRCRCQNSQQHTIVEDGACTLESIRHRSETVYED